MPIKRHFIGAPHISMPTGTKHMKATKIVSAVHKGEQTVKASHPVFKLPRTAHDTKSQMKSRLKRGYS